MGVFPHDRKSHGRATARALKSDDSSLSLQNLHHLHFNARCAEWHVRPHQTLRTGYS
jgi:hypothetical protein